MWAFRGIERQAEGRDDVEADLIRGYGSVVRSALTDDGHPHTVRSAFKSFRDRGMASFRPDKLGPDPDQGRRAAVTAKLSELLGQERTWTSCQLADALGPNIGIGHRQTRRYLALLKAGYRRTAPTVGHKQAPAKVGRAERVLDGLKKSGGGPAEAD